MDSFDGHDLGGKQGHGPIQAEAESDEPVFHADWERRVFALTLASGMLGRWSIDESRYARERQTPQDYLSNSYYENWLAGLQTLLDEKELLQNAELIEQLKARVPDAAAAQKILFSGGPTLMEDTQPPRYAVGDTVCVRTQRNEGHTRVPEYIRGAQGIVKIHHGTHVYPDASAAGDIRGEHLYSVAFAGKNLWGDKAEAEEVIVDLWEPYLEDMAP